MKKILASLLVLVMVFSCVGVALVSVSAEEEVNVFWLTHYNDHFVEGAGVIFTAEDSDPTQTRDDYKVSDNSKKDSEGKPPYTGWWLHVAFKPVQGFKTVFEVVEISNGFADGTASILAIPEGGFVYAVNIGNNWPELYKNDPKTYAGNANDPDYTNPSVNAMAAAMNNWKVGDRFVITGLDFADFKLPTLTPDKAWYEKTADGKESTYICTATYAKFDPNNPPKENDEPADGQDPAAEYRDEMAEKVGEPLTDPAFTVDLQSTIAENDAGKTIMTVVMTIKDLKEGVSFHGLDLIFHYDNSRMRLVTPLKGDEEGEADVLDCATKLPYDSWENLTQEVFDEEGKTTGDVEVRFVTATPEHALDASHTLELTFTFEMQLLNTYGGAYVPTDSISALYAPKNDESSKMVTYYGNGSSTVASFKAPEESSEPSTPGKPGDAGILAFAVMGILALAGAVTVIKVRR